MVLAVLVAAGCVQAEPAPPPEPAEHARCTLRVGEQPPYSFDVSLVAGTVVEDTTYGVPYRIEVLDGDGREFIAEIGSDTLGAASEVRVAMPDELAAGTLIVEIDGVTLSATGRTVALRCVGADVSDG